MSESFTAVLHPTTQLIAASVGIPGPPGTDGADGADGSQWFTGTGAPAPALGSPGDMYLENDGDVWQSNDVSGWLVTPTNIRGPVGATGATGATGSAGAQGPAGSVSSVGSHLLFSPDATYDIGQSGASRPRNLYLAGTATVPVISGGSGSLVLNSANSNRWVIETNGDLLSWGDGNKNIGAPGANRPLNLYLAGTATVGGITTPTISNAGNITVSPTGYLMLSVTGEIYINSAGGTRLQVGSNYVRTYQTFAFSPDNAVDIGYVASLRPRNLYLAGTATVGGVTGLTGAALYIQAPSQQILFGNGTELTWIMRTTGHFVPGTNNAFDIGESGNAPRNLYLAGTATVGGNLSLSGTGFFSNNVYAGGFHTNNDYGLLVNEGSGASMQLLKQNAVLANPGANNGKLYFRDGTTAGTLKLVVRAGAAGTETTVLDNISQ